MIVDITVTINCDTKGCLFGEDVSVTVANCIDFVEVDQKLDKLGWVVREGKHYHNERCADA